MRPGCRMPAVCSRSSGVSGGHVNDATDNQRIHIQLRQPGIGLLCRSTWQLRSGGQQFRVRNGPGSFRRSLWSGLWQQHGVIWRRLEWFWPVHHWFRNTHVWRLPAEWRNITRKRLWQPVQRRISFVWFCGHQWNGILQQRSRQRDSASNDNRSEYW